MEDLTFLASSYLSAHTGILLLDSISQQLLKDQWTPASFSDDLESDKRGSDQKMLNMNRK